MNLTLSDNTSLALTSTLVSVSARGKCCFVVVQTFHITGTVCPMLKPFKASLSVFNFISLQKSLNCR